MKDATRRDFLAASAAGSIMLSATIRRAFAAADIQVRWASLQPGFTVLPVQYILANDLGRKNGVNFPDPAPYTAVSTYYNDFVAGNYDVCIGSWDTFAARYQAGVPIKYLCSITDANMIALLAPKAGVNDVRSSKARRSRRCNRPAPIGWSGPHQGSVRLRHGEGRDHPERRQSRRVGDAADGRSCRRGACRGSRTSPRD